MKGVVGGILFFGFEIMAIPAVAIMGLNSQDLMKMIFSLSLVRINDIFNNLPLAFGQIGWIGFHARLFFSTL